MAAGDAIGHSSELTATAEKVDLNVYSGTYQTENISLLNAKKVNLVGVRDGDRLITTLGDTHTRKARIIPSEPTEPAPSQN
jgi:hypothetical protein